MASYRYNSFKFPANALKGVDADCIKGLRSFLSSRETAINTIHTASCYYADGPFDGQAIELCGIGPYDTGTLDISINGWIGRYTNGAWCGTIGKPVTVYEQQGDKAKALKAKTGKGFTMFESLLCELAEPIEDKTIPIDISVSRKFSYGSQDDFGLHINGRDGRPAILQDDFGDTFIVRNDDGRYETCKIIVLRAVYTIGRTTFKVLPTEHGIDNLRARLIKARKWFADKYFTQAEPDVDLLGDSISMAASADVQALVAIAEAQCTAIEDTADNETAEMELVTCEAESESAEHGASVGSANVQAVNSGASNNVIFADFRPVKAAENPVFTGDDLPADAPAAVSTDEPTTQAAEFFPKTQTPLMAQYMEFKVDHQKTVLFYRMGDFYELFNADAEKGARLLNITLTQRSNGALKPVKMSGVPFHAIDSSIETLVAAGESVAVCELVENSDGKFERQITRKESPKPTTSEWKSAEPVQAAPVIESKINRTALYDLSDRGIGLAEVDDPIMDHDSLQADWLDKFFRNLDQRVISKSGNWAAWFFMATTGAFCVRFFNANDSTVKNSGYSTASERMAALKALAIAADAPTDNPPTGKKPENGMPEQAQDGENTAVCDGPGTASAVSSEAPGAGSAVSTDFDLVETFKKNPLALLAQGMTVNELVGLGVHYPGHMCSASDDGAVTSVDDARGQRFGGLRLHCTLEDGRVVIAEPHYFEDDIRQIMQFNGKRHGDEYLSQLVSGAAMRKASESSAVEQAAKDHAQSLIDLVGQYPQLTKSENKHAGGKLAASNARILLKAAFKGQKFSVRSDYNSMRIEWTDGPTSDQVNDVVGMFDIGASDSQSDYFYKENTAFSDLFGGVQYLNTRREFSDGMVQQAIDTLYPDAAKRPPLSDWRKSEGEFSWNYDQEWARRRMTEILNSTSAYKPKAK